MWHADGQWEYQYGQPVTAGQKWKVGRLEVEALATSGHTPGSMSYLLRDPASIPWMLFSGDALFAGSIGRTDLPGGDYDQLMESLLGKIIKLGDDYTVYPGHGPATTIEKEISSNPFLRYE